MASPLTECLQDFLQVLEEEEAKRQQMQKVVSLLQAKLDKQRAKEKAYKGPVREFVTLTADGTTTTTTPTFACVLCSHQIPSVLVTHKSMGHTAYFCSTSCRDIWLYDKALLNQP